MPASLPHVLHTYQNHLLDSTVWRRFVPRTDDIVIATSYKSGTTWMQAIVAHLILGLQAVPNLEDFSPWMDNRFNAAGDVLERLDAQPHRRCIKSHLALDGLPFFPHLKYIVVGRDPRDVYMSMWNHHSRYQEALVAQINAAEGRHGPPLPWPPQDLQAFWQDWISRGWFAWEREGYPYWGNLHHTTTWWQFRHLENILLVHFNDLLTDLRTEISRIARFLDLACSAETIAEIAQAVTFSAMKRNAKQFVPGAETGWTGGSETFIFKGTNGRWKEVLTQADLARYTDIVAQLVTPACAAWLEHGRAAL